MQDQITTTTILSSVRCTHITTVAVNDGRIMQWLKKTKDTIEFPPCTGAISPIPFVSCHCHVKSGKKKKIVIMNNIDR